ncbi:universal stress protein [Halorarius litoreus]|uniref:universal stress protein n=1 Tax=Halorarius litoreus TaxID=2962676 RepID=UPI0020CD8E5D|nr:universal stress protein [Halorarius litoreus]
MYDDILLATDGSDGTTTAVTHAGTLAETYGATVHVLSVIDTRNRFESPTSGIAPEAWNEAERDRAETATEAAVAALPDGVTTERVHPSGVPQTEILAYAEAADVDVIVMGTHGRTGLDHYLIGSVTEKVVRRSPVQVLTVKLDEDDAET